MTGLSCLVSLKESTASTKSGHAVTRHISTLSFGVTEFFQPSVPCHSPSVGVCTSPACHSVTSGTLHRASKPIWYRLLLPASCWKFNCSLSVTRCSNRVLSYFLSGAQVEVVIRRLSQVLDFRVCWIEHQPPGKCIYKQSKTAHLSQYYSG